jgi:hypothetical protein
MHLPSLLVALGVYSAWAAPLEQQPLTGSGHKHAGPNKANPYAPGFRDEWDRKIDSQGDKLTPEPNVSFLVVTKATSHQNKHNSSDATPN